MLSNNLRRSFVSIGRSFSTSKTNEIIRLSTKDPRMAGVVIHQNTVYVSGQIPAGGPEEWKQTDVKEQTRTTLQKVDALLAEAGTNKSNLLSAQVWLKNMKDFAAMNEVWTEWIDPQNKPVRACVESSMFNPDIKVEVMVIAAKK
eukprot:c7550_g1_i1.p1 GENE.c7550_g1_i1~~c7550_g1_i1.p1  ORF type:complete len:145 (+),score=70.75 c7550_g1_i1:1-435(+)